jgi:hypothetical protein
MKPWLLPLLRAGAAISADHHGVTADDVAIARRAVAQSYRDDDCDPLARIVAAGYGDSSQRMKGALAFASALRAEASHAEEGGLSVGSVLALLALVTLGGAALVVMVTG